MLKLLQNNKLFDFYLFLFIFTMINREFLFFGLDLRYLLFIVGVAMVFISLKNKKHITLEKKELLFLLFYALLFISNICLLFNQKYVVVSELINLNILHINNFLLIITILFNKSQITKQKIINYYKLAMIFLILSFVLVLFHINIPSLFCGTDHIYVSGKDQVNLFGGYFRIAGFAEDANYAFMFFFSFIILLITEGFSKYNIILMLLSAIGMGLSFSKTQIIMLVPGVIIYLVYKNVKISKKKKDILLFIFVTLLFFLPFIMLKTNLFGSMVTMVNRYSLWNTASELMKKNHFLPVGLGGFRYYNYYKFHWLVQSHSTYVQILTELGLISALIYIFIAYFSLKKLGNIYFLLLLNFLFFSLTSETLYLQFFVFVMCVINIMCKNEGDNMNYKKGKKILFFVNSLGNGGAERVCDNLANEYNNEGYDVDFVVLFDERSYNDHVNYRILSLGINPYQSKVKIMMSILLNIDKVNHFIKQSEKDSKYSLITAHLPLSHICASLSVVGKRCLYVQHISLKSEGKYYALYKMFYKSKKNVCVSKGLGNEFVDLMQYDPHNIRVVYNPISVDEIRTKANKEFYFEKNPYFLCVGRLTQQKRFDRAIEIFYQGNFYKDYYLVLLGQGEKEEALRQIAKDYGIEDRVIFPGWQSNVYQWMKNAALLLHTSEREALPMVLIEALTCGTKIVASNCEYGAEEILREDYQRYIANQNDINDYIMKINQALKKFVVQNNYKILDECQGEYVCQKYLKVYLEMFNSTKGIV